MNGFDLFIYLVALIAGYCALRIAYLSGRMRERHEQTMRAPIFTQPSHVMVNPKNVYDHERDGL